ncbi:MAG: hypothetical protein QOE56_1954 [Solirubrobacterales bacterium]|jgi:hypothetical protein|nr:hypothetical protein [Solirubrobacterales bacterium]
MRLAVPIALVIVAAALLAGCGGSSDSTSGGSTTAPAGAAATSCETGAVDAKALRATAVSCGEARQALFAWQRAADCAGSPGASHSACTVRSYRCIGTRTDRGLAVSCARPGRSIAFIAKD